MKKYIINIPIIILFILFCLKLADAATFSIAVSGSNAINLVSLAIFIFVIIFICTFKRWNKTTRINILVCIIIYCCLNVFIVQTNFGVMCIKRSSHSSRVKSCWYNNQIITGAVEMYNMDHSTTMEKLDFPLLIKEKYLREIPKGSDKECYYTSHGNLCDDGYVYCIYHLKPDTGDDAYSFMDSDKYNKLYEELKYEITKAKEERYNNKTNLEKLKYKFEKKWPTIRALFYPILVAFFPYTLHPLN
ncbi:MAG: hypothetical protein J6Z11_06945 [Candidatus Riflebacteria bacterium]|nr:hypothetical protein [Candidatus Riflebacteria bacterium]